MIDTAAAAKVARVTVATVRHWCRVRAVAAARVAGRWAIEESSLARRVEIAAERRPAKAARKPTPLTSVKGQVPAVELVEQAARDHELARLEGNAADRVKRAARRVLDHTPDGAYGAVTVERFESSREVADLDEIKRVFAELGLGEVPMKRCAPSLVLTFADEAAQPIAAAA